MAFTVELTVQALMAMSVCVLLKERVLNCDPIAVDGSCEGYSYSWVITNSDN